MDTIGDSTIRDRWEEQVAAGGDDKFLMFEGAESEEASYSYREFNELIDRTARALHDDLGVGKGDTVTLHLSNCPAYLQTWFALLKLGAVTVHSNTNHTARETNYTVTNSDSRFVITEPEYANLVAEATADTSVDTTLLARTGHADQDRPTLGELVASADPDLPPVDLSADDTAQIIFTSGTTNDPKGVVHTHANLLYSGLRASLHTSLGSDDRVAMALPLFHVNGQSLSTLMSLTAGATLILLEGFSASRFIDQVRAHGATITVCIGTQIRAMLAQSERESDADNDLRDVITAINVTPEERAEFQDRFDVPLLNGYGLSETMTVVSVAPYHGDRRWPSIGRPAFDRAVHVVNDEGEPLPPGETGEIAVGGRRGRNLMQEYYRMPERTAEAFTEEGWLLTGDFGRFDEDGYLYFVDRKKNIIETRGENVSEAEVEAVIERLDGIEEAGVIGIPHEVYGEVVKAYLKPAGDPPSVEAVREHAAGSLAEFKIPQEVEFIDAFPRTSVGKIEKSTVREWDG
jgi:crotonobetaine/carnitine-CoA ligase